MSTSAYNQVGVDLPDPEPLPPPEPEPEPDRPDWLPNKFKDVPTFVEAYGNLERLIESHVKAKEEAEEYAQAMAEQMELAEQRQYQPQQETYENPLISQYEQAVMDGDIRTQLALQTYMASQLIDQRLQQQNQVDPEQVNAQAGIFARVVDQDVQAAYEEKYNEPWSQVKTHVGDFLAENMHWLEGVNTPEEAARRIGQAADFVRSQSDQSQEQTGNPQRPNAQKYLGQTLQGQGARTQASQDAAVDLVERMKQLSRPYGYNA